MTEQYRPDQTDLWGFGDITAGSIVAGSVLPGGSGSDSSNAGARIRAAEADRRRSMIRVAEQAAEIGLESAPALAAAAGLAPLPGPIARIPATPPARTATRPPPARLTSGAGRAALPGQRVPVPPRSVPSVAPTRRRNPVVLVLFVLLVAYLIARAAHG